MADETSAKDEKAGSKLAFSFEALLSTMLVGLASASEAKHKGIYATCGPVAAFIVAHGLRWLYDQYLYYRFKKDIKEEIKELRQELLDINTRKERKAAIPGEIAELRQLRQKQWLKKLEIKQ